MVNALKEKTDSVKSWQKSAELAGRDTEEIQGDSVWCEELKGL